MKLCELNINLNKYSELEINKDWTEEKIPGSIKYFELWLEVCEIMSRKQVQKSFLKAKK